ncbi:hypothetical protein EVAR_13926_1 [Eumeta japonica]|uniref:Uncharacterized protein n=1 Tax=Eumeta variegata TaxID=151549 RepID=A0A4C1U9S7_EUMVA|nr:hypothetical protein EVAR_13926_1 [Eumeta japonica]
MNEDNQIGEEDISEILDRLTWEPNNPDNMLSAEAKKKIADIILKEMQLHVSDSMGQNEFQLIISRISEFDSSFYFRI